MKLSIIFSFRNEDLNIPELVQRTVGALNKIPDCDYELIFVNDSSTDNSLNLLMELKRDYPITIINMSRRFGVTPCVLAGFSQSSGEAVVYLDSDLQDPPELIPALYEKFLEGFEVVHTRRVERLGESRLKMELTKLAYKVINYFSDIDLPINVGDYKLLSRRVVDQINSLEEYDPYMRGLSIWVGFKQYFYDYVREPRFAGEAKMPLIGKGPVKEFLRGLTAYSAGPLYASIIIGLMTTIVSVLLGAYAVVTKIFGYSPAGVSGILLAVCFFSGVTLFSNGLMGLYISRIYYETKKRPKYIIESIIN